MKPIDSWPDMAGSLGRRLASHAQVAGPQLARSARHALSAARPAGVPPLAGASHSVVPGIIAKNLLPQGGLQARVAPARRPGQAAPGAQARLVPRQLTPGRALERKRRHRDCTCRRVRATAKSARAAATSSGSFAYTSGGWPGLGGAEGDGWIQMRRGLCWSGLWLGGTRCHLVGP